MKKNKRIKNQGFTLLEMVTVITIIGILTTVAIPQISKYIDKANETKIVSAVSELNNTALILQTDHNSSEITIEKLLSEIGDKNLGLKIENNSNFSVGKYKGVLVIENEKVIAKVSQPESIEFGINGRLK